MQQQQEQQQQQVVVVTVPADATEGTVLQVVINGVPTSVVVPAGVKPGAQFTMAAPPVIQQAAAVHAVELDTAEQQLGDGSCGSLKGAATWQVTMDLADSFLNVIMTPGWAEMMFHSEFSLWWTLAAGPPNLVSIWAAVAGMAVLNHSSNCCCRTMNDAVQQYATSLSFYAVPVATVRALSIVVVCVQTSNTLDSYSIPDKGFVQAGIFFMLIWLGWTVNVLVHRVSALSNIGLRCFLLVPCALLAHVAGPASHTSPSTNAVEFIAHMCTLCRSAALFIPAGGSGSGQRQGQGQRQR